MTDQPPSKTQVPERGASRKVEMTTPVDVPEMLAGEAEQIKARRKELVGLQIQERRKSWRPSSNEEPTPAEQLTPRHYFGLALSGGGIRSATFNLGVLQGLSRVGLLPYVDYLSTVSGGGYIGTWLHGVIRRGGLVELQKILKRPDCEEHRAPSEDPIAFLRKYSSYLAPDLGLFSADFWVILVIWFRNMMLNLLMLVPLLALVVSLTLHAGLARQALFPHGAPHLTWSFLILFVIPLLAVVILAGVGVHGVVWPIDCKARDAAAPGRLDKAWVAVLCAALLLLSATALACSAGLSFADRWSWRTYLIVGGALWVLFFVLQLFGGFLKCYQDRHPDFEQLRWLWLVLFPVIAAAATASVLLLAIQQFVSWPNWYVVAYGPPLVGLVWIAGAGLHVGLMAADFPDSGREWFARIGAFLSIFIVAWASLFTICIFGPLWISQLPGWAAKLGITGTWLATTLGGVASSVSSKTGGENGTSGKSKLLEILGQLAPAVFVTGLFVLISYGLIRIIGAWQDYCTLQTFGEAYSSVLSRDSLPGLYLTLIFVVVLLLLPFRININEFSLHYFYKNRLVRCYLGASHPQRKASRVTGFDPCDDIPLATLLADPRAGSQTGCPGTMPAPYLGPYPIVCATLNLNTGSELAKRERKGSSFVFTPLYSGYQPPQSPEDERQMQDTRRKLQRFGFRRTCEYSVPGGLDIGTCMGISGAAANPNWGYHTSPAVAFLLTIFDVRLGWWIGNSRLESPSRRVGPRWALKPLISELLAHTDERSAYLNLSDGGHFENLGVYELVRRRCRYIIVGDGEQDNNLTFESLGGVIRKCRIDFGVTIDLNPRPIQLSDGFSKTHCVVGRVSYPPADDQANDKGWILYFKSSMTGDEPEDVAQYKSVHDDFPHETTANQFFTESQFESYRRLGLHVVQSAFGNVTSFDCSTVGISAFQERMKEESADQEANWLEHLFRCLEQQWYPPTDVPDPTKSHHAEEYTKLLNRLSADADLGYFDAQIISPTGPNFASATDPVIPQSDAARVNRKAFYYCLELIQLMENIWTDLHLFEDENRNNPKNGGWLTIFRFWAGQPLFRKTWDQSAYTFNPLFQQFFDTIKTEPPMKKKPECAAMPRNVDV